MKKIARIWFGSLPANKVEEYTEYVKQTGVKSLRQTKGNEGVLVITRKDKENAEIGVISFWKSREDIHAFAGPDINKAVYYPEDKKFLTKMEPELLHYEVEVEEF